jgi:hypothetical protein
MLTRHSPEGQALNQHAHLGSTKVLAGCDLRQVGRRHAKLVGKPFRRAALAGLDKGFEFHLRSLVSAKPYCQAFASSVDTKQTAGMEDVEIRRARLKAWFKDIPFPEKEKSYLSQLINGKASFGEKAARRLEKTYGMPHRYLDTPLDQEVPKTEYRELFEGWEFLLPGQQEEMLERIKQMAAINKESAERFRPKETLIKDEAKAPKRPATAVSAGPPKHKPKVKKAHPRRTET